ncbi:aminotransferase class I/II-fold pyridoxal phosphate-dependent enzyme, partial [Candidatus Bipolaricaulota bacterium]|nr:aminotransferase class I/II-fold pyridoxal phosphate-dependent enzyme [Candidatus Bipolaricaulota bacterium]
MGYPMSPRSAQAMGLYPYFIPLEQSEGTQVTVRGRSLIMIGSNNYLGLTAHPKVRQAAIDAVREFGTSCTGSRFLNGTLALHNELEERLARFVGKEKALVFSTGYQTNLGTLSALIGREDVIIGDKENHASLVDGSRLALGRLQRFRHNDIDDLERVLRACPDKAGKLVVVDGVFSMSGELAPLPEIVPLCEKYGARLMVDDAHGVGVIGGGRGTVARFGVTDDVDLIMGTFSKSFASIGGFIAGEETTIHWIKHLARSMIFSASLPAGNAAAALAALDVMEKEPERVERVNAIAERMRQGYHDLGYNVGGSETPIVPIMIGDQLKAIKMWRALFEAGVYTNVAVPPAVPAGKALLRTSYMATHTDREMDQVVSIFKQVGKAE